MRYLSLIVVITFLTFLSKVQAQEGSSSVNISVDGNSSTTPSKPEKNLKNSKSKKEKSTDTKKVKPDVRQKNDNESSMFKSNKRAWAVELHGGYPWLMSDIPNNFGIGYGLNVRKALGYSTSLRMKLINGYTTGYSYQLYSHSILKNNAAMNGKNNAKTNYYAAKKPAYLNYKMDFTSVNFELLYNLNNLSFVSEDPKFSIHMFVGIGGLMYATYVDQLDANGNMYDYSTDNIPEAASAKDKKKTIKAIKNMLDGDFETNAEGTEYKYKSELFSRNFTPITSAGMGVNYKVSDRFAILLEGSYGFTGKDQLDGQRWFSETALTSQPDAFWYTNLGVSIRLGRVENISWFGNPLALPYKTIMENKKKLGRIDDMNEKVDDLGKKVAENSETVDAMKADDDNDGVPNYFDKEDNTPEGAIVDGAGRTIFYKNDNGDLVFNDPNYSNVAGNNPQTGTDEWGNNNNAGNNNSGNKPNNNRFGNNQSGNNQSGNNQSGYNQSGNNSGYNSGSNTNKGKDGKYTFNPKDPNGKTVLIKGDGQGGYKAGAITAGTSSNMGFMPAIFFETDQAIVRQNYFPALFEVARMLKMNPGVKVKVVGYTDQRQTEQYNKELGMRRSKAVIYALTKYFGVSPDQLIAETQGKNEPLTNLSSTNALAANRRVQFEMVSGSVNKGDMNKSKSTNQKKVQEFKQDQNTPKPNEIDQDINKLLENIQPMQQGE